MSVLYSDTGAAKPAALRRHWPINRTLVLFAIASTCFTLDIAAGPTRFGFDPIDGFTFTALYSLIDIFALLALLFAGPATLRAIRRRETAPLINAGGLLVAAMVVSFAFHPVDRGAQLTLRLAAAVVVADWISRSDATLQKTVAHLIACLGCFEWALAVFQLISGRSLGLYYLGEPVVPFLNFQGVRAPLGTLWHPYLLSSYIVLSFGMTLAFALRGVLNRKFAFALAIAGPSAAAFCFARLAVVSVALVVGATLFAAVFDRTARKFLLSIVAVAVVSLGSTLLITRAGWESKVEVSKESGVTTGRSDLLKQNIKVFEKNPLIGVGPGRYTMSLMDAQTPPRVRPKTPHMVPAATLAEMGSLAIPALVCNAVALALLAWRRKLPNLIAAAAIISPIMLEQFTWNMVEGMLMIALAFGTASIGEARSATTARPAAT